MLFHHFSHFRLVIKGVLLVCAAVFMFLALLQPQWGEQEDVVHQHGRDIFIALDISRSMLAQDCSPNRLVRAKEKIKKLLRGLSSDRVGLILFSGSSFVQCPLTTDYAAFNSFLDQVDAETISGGTTALDAALKQGIRQFSKIESEQSSRILVVLTDGEDFSLNLETIKQEAKEKGVYLIMLGVGTERGAPVPIVDDHGGIVGHQKDESGSVVISRLNSSLLASIARDTGGEFVYGTDNNDDLKKMVCMVERFEKHAFEDRTVKSRPEQYPYVMFLGALCLLVEWLL